MGVDCMNEVYMKTRKYVGINVRAWRFYNVAMKII